MGAHRGKDYEDPTEKASQGERPQETKLLKL